MNARQRRLCRRAIAREVAYLDALAYGVEPLPTSPRVPRHVARLLGWRLRALPPRRAWCAECGRRALDREHGRWLCAEHLPPDWVPF